MAERSPYRVRPLSHGGRFLQWMQCLELDPPFERLPADLNAVADNSAAGRQFAPRKPIRQVDVVRKTSAAKARVTGRCCRIASWSSFCTVACAAEKERSIRLTR